MELVTGSRVSHPRYGEGLVSKSELTHYEIFFEKGGKIEITKRNAGDLDILEANEPSGDTSSGLDIEAFEKVLVYTLDKYNAMQAEVPLGEKWTGGMMTLQPANSDLKPKEIPVEAFFHKIVMLRDRLRVLEQNINSHSKLSDEEKLHLQQYITRIYGSLTTFNVLFDDKAYYFRGVKTR